MKKEEERFCVIMIQFFKSSVSVLLSLCYAFAGALFYPKPETDSVSFAKGLGPGWNLGNTLEAWQLPMPEDTETCWGNPLTTREMIEFVKQCGFRTVRIPVTWFGHMDEEGNIESEWMERVAEVVDYALESGMYAVLNTHHDDVDWLIPDSEHEEQSIAMIKKVWGQIARRFAQYDERLIFETMNEPRIIGPEDEWTGNDEVRKYVNKLNFAALETIRQSGGKNGTRYVFITPCVAGTSEENVNALEVPGDPHVMVSLHYYPGTAHRSEFADCEKMPGLRERREMFGTFRRIYKKFTAEGIGVCITEFGWTDREHLDNLAFKAKIFTKMAESFGMPCFVWDNGESFMLIDRNNLTEAYPDYIHAITE